MLTAFLAACGTAVPSGVTVTPRSNGTSLQGVWVGELCGTACVTTALAFSGSEAFPRVEVFVETDGRWEYVMFALGARAGEGLAVTFADDGARLDFSGMVIGASFAGTVRMQEAGGYAAEGTFRYHRE